MKIAYLSTFYPFRGGIAQFNASLYRALESSNTVKAITFTRQYPHFLFPGETQFVTSKDSTADAIPSERMVDTLNPFSYFSSAKKITSFSPDILLMKYWMSYMAPALGVVANRVKQQAKVITILDNVIPHEKRFFDEALTKFFLNQNHGFVVMSEAVKKDLIKLHPKAKYVHAPHPLYNHFGLKINSADARKQLAIPENKKVLLFFGFIREYKGLDVLIEALSKLNDEYVLVIAGEVYGSFEKYSDQIQKLSVAGKIIQHVRYISDSEVPLFFSAADVCVLPYKSATQSGITSIAYHFDLPIIATHTGGLSESIHHHQTGLVVALPDATLLAHAIEMYFNQHKKREMEEAIRKLKQNLSWDRFAETLLVFSKSL
jgi:glycosyltransferase involved in cell wall biosynthesis